MSLRSRALRFVHTVLGDKIAGIRDMGTILTSTPSRQPLTSLNTTITTTTLMQTLWTPEPPRCKCGHPDVTHCMRPRYPSCEPVNLIGGEFLEAHQSLTFTAHHNDLLGELDSLAAKQKEQADQEQQRQRQEIAGHEDQTDPEQVVEAEAKDIQNMSEKLLSPQLRPKCKRRRADEGGEAGGEAGSDGDRNRLGTMHKQEVGTQRRIRQAAPRSCIDCEEVPVLVSQLQQNGAHLNSPPETPPSPGGGVGGALCIDEEGVENKREEEDHMSGWARKFNYAAALARPISRKVA